VYIADVVRANVSVLDSGDNDVFNVGWGRGTSVNQIFHSLKKILNADVPEVHGPAKLGEVRETYLNSDKAARLLNWVPQVTLQDGLRRTVDYFAPVIAAAVGVAG